MGFNDLKKEYVIEDMYPPKRPLMNYLWNEEYLAIIDQFGCGKGRMSTDDGLVHMFVKDSPSRLLYIKDGDKIFSPNRNFEREDFDVFKTVVGMGYSTVISEYRGLHTEFTILIPEKGMCECWRTSIKNVSDTEKTFDFYTYADINVILAGHHTCVYGNYDKDLNGVYYTYLINNSPTEYSTFYMSTDAEITSYDTAKRRFVGHYGLLNRPDGVCEPRLACDENTFDFETITALHTKITLAPGEEKVVFTTIGSAKNIKSAANQAKEKLGAEAFTRELEIQKKKADGYDNCVYIDTPDEDINRFINIWLKRQLSLGKTWGRTYAKGFRDVMQDIAGFLSLDSNVSREKILDAVQYQFEDGNTIREWAPRAEWPYRDGAVWLLQTVPCYVKETGDTAILDEVIPYLDSDKSETLYEHCIRGLDFLLDGLGEHGLCLWGGGDWNDSFNYAGLQMKGESVWLSLATVKGLNDFVELLLLLGKTDVADAYTKKRDILIENIQKYGYDEDHYIYGYTDWGERIGSYDTEEGRVFLNPQTWAVLSGVAEDNDAILDIVEKELSCDYGYVLQTPCYSKPNPHLGRIAYFCKGFYENGSVYNHGGAFKIVADCLAGRNDYAYNTVKKMLPTNPKNNSEKSGMEPYAISNMYIGPENVSRAGESPMHWITGTSSWLFRGIVEYIIGVRADFDGLIVKPRFPKSWDKVTVKRTFRGAVYNITIERTGEKSICEGNEQFEDKIPVFEAGTTHDIYVTF